MSKSQIEDIYPLSPMQQGMLFHSLYAPASGVYVEQTSCLLTGELNISAFERAWKNVIERHSILRTAFVWEEVDEPMQVVYKDVDVPLLIQDWRDVSGEEQAKRFEEHLQAERDEGFDLADAPLMRIGLFRLTENAYHLAWSHHHLLLDGWSLPIIMGEVFASYESYRQGKPASFGPTRPFKDYIAWLQQQNLPDAEKFWRRELDGFAAPTPLIIEKPRKNLLKKEDDYAKQHITIPAEITAELSAFARQHQLTLSTLFQGAWTLALSRYCGDEDILFGLTVSGRPAQVQGADSMVGLFINTLPVRVKVEPQRILVPWLQELQARQFASRQYEFSSLVQIQGWSQVPRDLPLFESLMVFENYPVSEALSQQETDLKISNARTYERTNYPITLAISPSKQIIVEVAYDTGRFNHTAITRLLHHIESTVAAFAANPDQSLWSISILTEQEQKQLLGDWNGSVTEFQSDKCIHHLVAEQAEKTPEATAATFQDTRITYQDLDRKGNQLAHYLHKIGVGPDVLVGICIERSFDMLIGLLGILKAGGAYVPLEPSLPMERLQYMIEDGRVTLALTQDSLRRLLPEIGLRAICLDSEWSEISQESANTPSYSVTVDNLAYVIYTSGTTGKPKGTMVAHSSLVNHALAFGKQIEMSPNDRVLQFISLSFDAAGEEIYPLLLHGGGIVLHSAPGELTGQELTNFIEQNQVTILHLPVAFWHQWMDEVSAKSLALPLTLRWQIVGGEAPSPERIAKWNRLNSGRARLLNAYGPTEATITTTSFSIGTDHDGNAVPIGRPIDNAQVYILDGNLQPTPIGCPGELFIGGFGLARGYLNRPEMTAEKFIPNPFSHEPGARLYRTGDLARFLSDGNIEFVGRIDHQVKVRGFRVELGEIEGVLREHVAVGDVLVLAKDEEQISAKRLIAYVILKGAAQQRPNVADLRDFMLKQLPEYMVPAAFVFLDAWPLNTSGKIDLKALPEPDQSRILSSTSYVAPRDQREALLADLYSQILNVEKIGVHDNFFELGGHSLLATKLLSRLREAFQAEIPLRRIFEAPTVALLAKAIEEEQAEQRGLTVPTIKPVSHEAEVPLSFAQQRLWFLDQLAPGSSSYNIPISLRLKGKLNIKILEKSILEMLRRHESLRTRFVAIEGKPSQVIEDDIRWAMDKMDLSSCSVQEQETIIRQKAQEEVARPFDLSQCPLLRIILLRLGEEEHVILLTLHHIISDGWSVAVLIREMTALYEAFAKNRPSPLPPLSIQYADFAAWQKNWLQGEVLEREMSYWREELSGLPPLLELPLDFPRPALQSSNGGSHSIKLSKSLADGLLALSREENSTVFMTLLAAFQVLLSQYSRQADLAVGTPIANRNRLQTENLIGFFVNTLVLRARVMPELRFREFLAQVRETALGAFAHQDVPFEMLVDALHPQRDLSHSPLFQVMFVMQNTPMDKLELAGLTLEPIVTDNASAKFDLTLIVEEQDGFLATMEYNSDLFSISTMTRMLNHFQGLLEKIITNPDLRISSISLLGEQEQQQILNEWNKTEADYPRDRCVHECIEYLAEQNPDTLAVVFDDVQLRYDALNRRANQLARYLQKLGTGTESLVGICMDRSPEMVIGILATLKAGGAFVPLDPNYPRERLSFMIEDSGISVLLTQKRISADFGFAISDSFSAAENDNPQSETRNLKVLALDTRWESISAESDQNLSDKILPENLAYVIYTSGSTGKPKGTMLQHRGLCNLAKAQQEAFNIDSQSRILQFSSLSFDASVWETVMALLNGAALCLTQREHLMTGQGLLEVLRAMGITTVTLPPSVLAVMPEDTLSNLKTIITAGEKCTRDLVQRWANGRAFFNAYGPTETTVCASMFRCHERDEQNPPIGQPINNTELYILNPHLQPVPVGVAGELLIGGVSLARGYLNRPDLTAERFVPNPFSEKPGERLYRTGDLVRYLPDGNIEFLGRIDHQVKVRGFRIELGEIEATLVEHPSVRDAAVLAREDVPGDVRLAAYVVAKPDTPINSGDLRSYLRERLPDYMVPSHFIMLDTMPLTPSNKVDRQALPAPDQSRPDLQSEYIAPRNEVEQKLAEICGALLNLKKVGVFDSFFDLGGHSLLATQFISRLRTTFEVELPLRSLFEKPTIAELAEEIARTKESACKPQVPTITRVAREQRRVKFDALKTEVNP